MNESKSSDFTTQKVLKTTRDKLFRIKSAMQQTEKKPVTIYQVIDSLCDEKLKAYSNHGI